MTEQKIELKIINALNAALTAASVTGVQVLSAWQSAATGSVKGVEDASRGYLSVKVAPRQHETFLIAEASMEVTVELNVRAEMDPRGVNYLTITDALTGAIYPWQKSFATYETAFAIANEFIPTGFRLDGGDCGLDKTNGTWTWLQKFTIQGIINN